MQRVYLATTSDQYETPLAVFDTPQEMSAFLGITKSTLYRRISKGLACTADARVYIIEIDDEVA